MTDTEIVEFLLADANRREARRAGHGFRDCEVGVSVTVKGSGPVTRELLVKRIEQIITERVKERLK